MSDEQVWGEDLPGIGKRRLEAVDGDEESARKAHKRTAPTNSWFNSSFSMPDQRVSAKAGNVVLTAARSVPWIRPAFSREPTPVAVPPVLSASRRQEASTSAAARTNGASTSDPSRLLQTASQLGRQISLPPSTPTRPPAQRRTGPPAFALPGKQANSNERIHNPLSHLKQLVPPSAGKSVRSPVTARFPIADSPQKASLRPVFTVKSDGSDGAHIDELDRGLLPSPEKKGRAHAKGGLADRADMIISKQATSNKLWYISEGSASASPDFKVHITAVLSSLSGRTLTQCRTVQNAAPRDASSWTEGIVLFGPGNNKELKEGMTVGVWKPWGDVLDKPLKSPIEGLEEGLPPANSDEQPNKDEAPHKVTESEPEELPESVIEDQNAIILTKEDEPMNVDALRPQEKPPGATPALGPRALLVTRYLILD